MNIDYRGPKAGSPIISSIPGSAKNIEESGICRGLWCPVRFDGIEGWVHKRFLSVVPYPDIPVARINPAVRDNQYSQYAPDPRHDRDISGRDFRQRYDDEYIGLNRRRPSWFQRFLKRNPQLLRRHSRY